MNQKVSKGKKRKATDKDEVICFTKQVLSTLYDRPPVFATVPQAVEVFGGCGSMAVNNVMDMLGQPHLEHALLMADIAGLNKTETVPKRFIAGKDGSYGDDLGSRTTIPALNSWLRRGGFALKVQMQKKPHHYHHWRCADLLAQNEGVFILLGQDDEDEWHYVACNAKTRVVVDSSRKLSKAYLLLTLETLAAVFPKGLDSAYKVVDHHPEWNRWKHFIEKKAPA